MAKRIDLTGRTFGRLTVLGISHHAAPGILHWLCRCECGAEKAINGSSLKKGATVSCGCRMRETIADRVKLNTTHGHTIGNKPPKSYKIWNKIRQRCSNPTNPAFKDYGGRGILVCDRWSESFENFFADMGECPEGLSIDRIDNSKGYEPGNCKWATAKEQANNRRPRSDSRWITFNGRTLTLSQWATEMGVRACALSHRLDQMNWPIERALTEKVERNAWHRTLLVNTLSVWDSRRTSSNS